MEWYLLICSFAAVCICSIASKWLLSDPFCYLEAKVFLEWEKLNFNISDIIISISLFPNNASLLFIIAHYVKAELAGFHVAWDFNFLNTSFIHC